MENINTVLGLPQPIPIGGKVVVAYPVTMRNMQEFVANLSKVNTKKLWANYIFGEDGINALNKIIEITFKDENDIPKILDNIHAGNFEDLMNQIMNINGIALRSEEDPKKMEEV